MSQLNTRSNGDPKDQWDLSHLIENQEVWEQYYADITAMAETVASYSGRLSEDPAKLAACLKENEIMEEMFSRLYTYSYMKFHEDTSVSDHQEATEKVNALMVKVSSASAFIEPELMAMDVDQLNTIISTYEPLKQYAHYIEDLIRQKAHILPKEQEALLAGLGDFAGSPGSIFAMFNDADLKFPDIQDESGETVPLTKGNFIKYLESPDVKVRESAFKTVYATYKASENTLASILTANLKKNVFLMGARGFSSSCEASLFSKNIDISVYDNLIEAVNNHLDLLHRYVALRKKVLRLDELHMYDLYIPMIAEEKEEISYSSAKATVLEALQVMGPEYIAVVQKAFDEKWIDVYENEGKRSGAYSWGTYGAHPYILLNYQDNIKNMFTLAHELGHTMHSYFSSKAQPYTYASYPIFLAEVASTVNESLLMQHLLKTTTDKNKRLFLLNHYMESFRSTLYRQTMFAEYEKIIHTHVENGQALTAKTLSDLYYDLNVKYYGNDLIVDEEIAMEWSRIPHFYSSFYVYQYATGFSSAIAIAKNILESGDKSVANYIRNFLSAGKSKYPLETLKAAGVDMTTAAPVTDALKVFEQVLDEMESLLA